MCISDINLFWNVAAIVNFLGQDELEKKKKKNDQFSTSMSIVIVPTWTDRNITPFSTIHHHSRVARSSLQSGPETWLICAVWALSIVEYANWSSVPILEAEVLCVFMISSSSSLSVCLKCDDHMTTVILDSSDCTSECFNQTVQIFSRYASKNQK